MATKLSERGQAITVLTLPIALATLAGTPAGAVDALTGPGRDTLGAGPLLGVVALGAWSLTAWLTLVVLMSLSADVPGTLGRCASRCLPRLAPVSVRALVRTATGLAVAGTVILGGATAQADPTRPHPAGAGTVTTQDLDWPTTSDSLALPTSPAAIRPATVRPATVRPATAPVARPPAAVVVHTGDSLWDLAAKALGPDATPRQIATSWPTWWTANREVIGEDPNLLRPGTSLLPPNTPRSTP